MFVRSVRIRNYKSLASVELTDLTPVTILVGTNAVGKSNLVDALRFLRDMVVDGLDHAVSKRGGIEVIRQYSPRKPYQISIGIEYANTAHGEVVGEGSYEITIASLSKGNFRVEREVANWCEKDFELDEKRRLVDRGTRQHAFARGANGGVIIDGEIGGEFRLPPDQAALGQRVLVTSLHPRSHLLPLRPNVLAHVLSTFRFSALYPNTLREPSRPETDRILKESGENWASVLKAMKKTGEGKAALGRVLEMMRLVMPGLEDVTVKTVGGYLVPQFRVRDSKSAAAHDFDPVQLSDGTLRIFGLLLALYQLPAPRLMALEEPEQAVHPGILSTLAEAFREVSERIQLFITTHSPHLVDLFDPAEIRVVTMKNGKTLVSAIKASQIESVKEKLISLHELMAAEGLQPEEA